MLGVVRLVWLSLGVLIAISAAARAQASRPTWPAPASKPVADPPDFVSGCVMPGPPRQLPPPDPCMEVMAWCNWLGASGRQAWKAGVGYFSSPPDPSLVGAVFAAATGANAKEGTDDGIRRWAAMLLARLPGEPHAPLRGLGSVAELTLALVSGDEDTQRKLLPWAGVLGQGKPGTVAALIRLTRAGTELRWRAALALSWSAGRSAAREAVPALEELLRDEDVIVRAFAAAALARLAPRSLPLATELVRLREGADRDVATLVLAVDRELELAERAAASRPAK